MTIGECGECLECALQNSLGADVDPTARGHLAVHHEALAIELVEVIPVGPFADEVGVGDDDARSHVVRRKDGDGLAGLDKQCVFGAEAFELADDGVVALPIACGFANAPVNDEVGGALGDFGVEIVHQAAQRSFLLPAFAAKLGAAGGADGCIRGDGHAVSRWLTGYYRLLTGARRCSPQTICLI